MSTIKITNLSFSYGGEIVFDKVNLELDSNYKLGLDNSIKKSV